MGNFVHIDTAVVRLLLVITIPALQNEMRFTLDSFKYFIGTSTVVLVCIRENWTNILALVGEKSAQNDGLVTFFF